MTTEERDAEVFARVWRRLLGESFGGFREAHEAAMRGFDSLTVEEMLENFGQAIRRERDAIEQQRGAIELRGRVMAVRARGLARVKAAPDE